MQGRGRGHRGGAAAVPRGGPAARGRGRGDALARGPPPNPRPPPTPPPAQHTEPELNSPVELSWAARAASAPKPISAPEPPIAPATTSHAPPNPQPPKKQQNKAPQGPAKSSKSSHPERRNLMISDLLFQSPKALAPPRAKRPAEAHAVNQATSAAANDKKPKTLALASGEVIKKRGKEQEEKKPKKLSWLKQDIQRESLESFEVYSTSLGQNAGKIIDDRVQTYIQRLAAKGIQLRIGTERQMELLRLSKVPRIPREMRVRGYCRQLITTELNDAVKALLAPLTQFQAKSKAQGNVGKAKANLRFKVGLNEAIRAVALGSSSKFKAKLVIVAPNIDERNGLDSRVMLMFELARKNAIPVVFALSMKKLGSAIKKPLVKVSVIAVVNVEGAREQFKALVGLHDKTMLWSALQYKIQQEYIIKLTEGVKVTSVEIVTSRNELVSPGIQGKVNLASYRPSNAPITMNPLLLLRVATSPPTIGSLACVIRFNSVELHSEVINTRPYILHATMSEASKIHTPVRLVPGNYSLAITPFSEFSVQGQAGDEYRLEFEVIDSPQSDEERMTADGVDVHTPSDSDNEDEPNEDNEAAEEASDEEEDTPAPPTSADRPDPPQIVESAASISEDKAQAKSGLQSGSAVAVPAPTGQARPLLGPVVPPTRNQIKQADKTRKQFILLRKDDEEEVEGESDEEDRRSRRLREARKRSTVALPQPRPDDENPDYLACTLPTLYSSNAVQRLRATRPKASTTPVDPSAPIWTLFFKVPGQYLTFILESVSSSATVGDLKAQIASSSFGKDRPVNKMKLAFYSKELDEESTILGQIEGLGDFGTVVLLRKKDSVDLCLSQVFQSAGTLKSED